ncbi:hypothetical protein BKA69DRAFT_368161 [Paraphysoderma sedebokerense]|nr:hypothetical protein BKA69DRAFT_368161 [Paraphysoderma sedebokerense]
MYLHHILTTTLLISCLFSSSASAKNSNPTDLTPPSTLSISIDHTFLPPTYYSPPTSSNETEIEYAPRGKIVISEVTGSNKRKYLKGVYKLVEEGEGSQDFWRGKERGWYVVRFRNENGDTIGERKVDGCLFDNGDYKERINVHLDDLGTPFHIDYLPSVKTCLVNGGNQNSNHKNQEPQVTNVKVRVFTPAQGVSPILSSAPPTKSNPTGSKDPNQPEPSFIQKYWMYIVPLLILLLLSPSEPAASGGGSAGSGGRAAGARGGR